MMLVAFADPFFRAPAIVFDLTEKFSVVTHHPRTAGFVVIKVNESAVTEFLFPVGNIFGKNMRVDVDGKQMAHAAKMRKCDGIRSGSVFVTDIPIARRKMGRGAAACHFELSIISGVMRFRFSCDRSCGRS